MARIIMFFNRLKRSIKIKFTLFCAGERFNVTLVFQCYCVWITIIVVDDSWMSELDHQMTACSNIGAYIRI